MESTCAENVKRKLTNPDSVLTLRMRASGKGMVPG